MCLNRSAAGRGGATPGQVLLSSWDEDGRRVCSAPQTALDKDVDRRLNPSLAERHSDVPRIEQRISHM